MTAVAGGTLSETPVDGTPTLVIEGLAAGYGGFRVLEGVSMTVAREEVVAVLGANGAGKTTLLRAIAGVIRPTAGRISVRGTTVEGKAAHMLTRMGVGHVPSGRELFPDLTVEDNLKVGGHNTGRRRAAEIRSRVLDLFPPLAQILGRPAGALSGGEQQMLAVGRALMTDPHLLLLDEPSTGLAPFLVASLFEALRQLIRDGGMSILIVEQNASLALGVAQRAYVLQNGRCVLEGDAKSLTGDALVRAYLGA